jgi:hypothetical protein
VKNDFGTFRFLLVTVIYCTLVVGGVWRWLKKKTMDENLPELLSFACVSNNARPQLSLSLFYQSICAFGDMNRQIHQCRQW